MEFTKNLDMHCVVFDGTSYFVSLESELAPDMQLVEKFYNLDKAFDLAEKLEDELNGMNEESYYN